jgi:uncharacterized lipoprotein YmbA
MKKTRALLAALVPAATLAALLTAGCGTTPSAQFYLLRDTPSPASRETTAEDLLVLAGPINIPPHLDRSHIALSTGGTELVYDEFRRWAEPLDAGILRVIRSELAAQLPGATVTPFAWVRSTPYDYRVPIYVLTFEGAPGEEARLAAQWAITSHTGSDPLVIRTSTLSMPPRGEDLEALVQAQSELVQKLGREIAGALRNLPKVLSGE